MSSRHKRLTIHQMKTKSSLDSRCNLPVRLSCIKISGTIQGKGNTRANGRIGSGCIVCFEEDNVLLTMMVGPICIARPPRISAVILTTCHFLSFHEQCAPLARGFVVVTQSILFAAVGNATCYHRYCGSYSCFIGTSVQSCLEVAPNLGRSSRENQFLFGSDDRQPLLSS